MPDLKRVVHVCLFTALAACPAVGWSMSVGSPVTPAPDNDAFELSWNSAGVLDVTSGVATITGFPTRLATGGLSPFFGERLGDDRLRLGLDPIITSGEIRLTFDIANPAGGLLTIISDVFDGATRLLDSPTIDGISDLFLRADLQTFEFQNGISFDTVRFLLTARDGALLDPGMGLASGERFVMLLTLEQGGVLDDLNAGTVDVVLEAKGQFGSLAQLPQPSTMALALLGIVALLVLRGSQLASRWHRR